MSEQQFLALLVRAFKTFVQAALAFALLGLANIATVAAAKALIIAAVAAGISAVFNLILKPVEAK